MARRIRNSLSTDVTHHLFSYAANVPLLSLFDLHLSRFVMWCDTVTQQVLIDLCLSDFIQIYHLWLFHCIFIFFVDYLSGAIRFHFTRCFTKRYNYFCEYKCHPYGHVDVVVNRSSHNGTAAGMCSCICRLTHYHNSITFARSVFRGFWIWRCASMFVF